MRCECLLSRQRWNAAVKTPQRKRDWVIPNSASAREAGGSGVAFASAARPDHVDLRVRWGNEEVKNGNGLIWDTAEEMTELTPEACHILFSAPMSPRLEMVRAQSHASGKLTDLIT